MLPIVQAMQLLDAAGYDPLGPLIEHHEFPLLVKKDQVVFVAKLARPDELPILEKLRAHPVIRMPKIQSLLTDDDCVVTVETLINGQNLSERLTANGPMAPADVLQVAIEILESLEQLAALDIVHRDIKLSNIMFSREHYYLIDVNAAREYHEQQATDTRLLGTSGFAAPENYGFAQTDQRSDLYGLGVVLNCLLTGKIPVNSLNNLNNVTDVKPWHQIITKATALDPDQRYQSAEAMLAALPGQVPVRERVTSSYQKLVLRYGHVIKRFLWGFYWIMLFVIAVSGTEQTGLAARLSYWWSVFVLLVAPVLLHFGNVWLYRRLPNVNWHRYRGWLRAAETLVIFATIGISS